MTQPVSSECSHGAITPYPSSDRRWPGYAQCEVCGARLTANATLESRITTLLEENERLKSQAPYVEASGHYCDGMTQAWTDAQAAIGEVTTLTEMVKFLLGFVPAWAKEEVPEGYGETFYGTLSAEGDRKVKARVDEARKLIEVGE